MSRLDLDVIQSQLKTAIQNHQMLVSRIQLQPQDMGLRTQLHNLQKEIMLMSQRQKHVVQKLRKDLIERKPSSTEFDKVYKDPKLSPLSTLTKPLSQKGQAELTCDNVDETSPLSLACDTTEKPPAQKSATSPLRVPQFLPNACRSTVPQTTTTTPTTTTEIILSENKPSAMPPTTIQPSATPPRAVTPSAQPKRAPAARSGCYRDRQKVESPPEDPELRKKLAFMAGIQLFPPDSLKEMQNKRSERKRRSTNNPNFAYGFELERRPRLSNYLGTEYFGAQKPKARQSSWKADGPSPKTSRSNTPEVTAVNGNVDLQIGSKENKQVHENVCRVCHMSGHLLLCDTCSGVYHLQCLSPPLAMVPECNWSCPKCQEAHHRSAISLAAVTTYIATKTGKEEEKRKLLKRSTELLQEKSNLENRTKELNEILARQGIKKQELIEMNRKAQESVEHLKNFVKIVQSS